MKYYKIEIKSDFENDMLVLRANGDNVENGEEYFDLIDEGELLDSPPLYSVLFF